MRATAWLDSLNTLAPAFIDAALRGALVLLLALAVTQAMRRRTAAARHLVWVGAITVQLALPVFATWGPRWKLALPDPVANAIPIDLRETSAPPVVAATNTEASPARAAIERAGPSLQTGRQDIPVSAEVTAHPGLTGREILLVLWLLGAAIILVRLAIGTTIVASLARKGNRMEDGNWLSLAQRTSAALQIDRPLTLLRGGKLGVPVTWGIVYPVVLLPDDADNWPEARRRFVLVHEMAHVKRLDALTQLAGQLALALFWFDPFVWIANRRMQLEREHACDDYVIRHGTSPSLYAEELLSMVRALGTPEHRSAQPAFAALAMARRSEFEGRMLSILDPVLDRHPLSKGRTLASALGALLLVIPLAALHPYQRATLAHAPFHAPAATVAEKANLTAVVDSPSQFGKSADDLGETTATLGAGQPTCDGMRLGTANGSTTHIHSDDGDSPVLDYTKFAGNRCSSASIIGRIEYSANEDDVIGMPSSAHASFRERTANDDRKLTLTAAKEGPAVLVDGALQGSKGQVTHLYRHNGKVAAFDDAARHWFAAFLPEVLLEAGLNVGPRVARWRAEGGVTGVLNHIASMSSPLAKRSHYESLLQGNDLSSDELDKVVRSASEHLRGSSGDMRAVLTRAIPNARLSRQAASSLESAISSMASSGDMTAVLEMYGQTDDRDQLLSAMRVARSIASSGDRARLLGVLAPRYLTTNDRALHDAYFGILEQIPSSGDMRNTLMIAIRYSAQNAGITRQVILASRSVASSGDMSQVLIALASAGAINTKELRDAFFSAVAEVPSESDRSRVLQVAAGVIR